MPGLFVRDEAEGQAFGMQGKDGWALRQQGAASAAGISAHDCPDHRLQWSYCPGGWLDVTTRLATALPMS